MLSDLTLPDFLDRKKNGVVSGVNSGHGKHYVPKAGKIVWPKKRNWRKIAARRRRLEGALPTITQHRGQ